MFLSNLQLFLSSLEWVKLSLFLPLVFRLLPSRPLKDGARLEVEQVAVQERQAVLVGNHLSRKRVLTTLNFTIFIECCFDHS